MNCFKLHHYNIIMIVCIRFIKNDQDSISNDCLFCVFTTFQPSRSSEGLKKNVYANIVILYLFMTLFTYALWSIRNVIIKR